jgi:subtilisin family serine protease
MKKIRFFSFFVILSLLILMACQEAPDTLVSPDAEGQSMLAKPRTTGMIGINIVLNTEVTDAILADLGGLGKVLNVYYELDALRVLAKADQLSVIQSLPYVAAANPDAERTGRPIDTVLAEDFTAGLNSWNLDVVNVTVEPFSTARNVDETGEGVYVGVLDTGLLQTWRQYFPEERIAVEYANSFGGGGASGTNISEQPNKWERDTYSHGTHVTSTILGYSFYGTPFNGVAPMATIIPVKVLNQNGMGWSSVIAEGITYIADLKAGPLAGSPVVINMSLGGPELDAVEKAAIDYAISKGVIIVASAGNRGTAGMGYPGAYEPVISVAASGWIGEWFPPENFGWWYNNDDPEPNITDLYYITDFSSRELDGQDLDVAAPGSWVVGPFQLQMGKPSYYFLGGTSMASPHVAGIVALMAEKNSGLTAAQAEFILENTALTLPEGSLDVYNPDGSIATYIWDTDATGAGLVTADAALAATP